MAAQTIYGQKMTSAERSRRSLLKQRQELAAMRTYMIASVDLHLSIGRKLSEMGERLSAHDSFVMAEKLRYYIQMLNDRLAPHEHLIESVILPPRSAKDKDIFNPEPAIIFTESQREEQLEFARNNVNEMEKQRTDESTKKQSDYAAGRAEYRKGIEAKYGHLAKAEREG